MNAIEITNLGYTYEDGTTALTNVNLAVKEGDTITLLGRNGAGKSTLLKIIAGLSFPFKGTVKIFGTTLTKKNSDAVRRRIGILFQEPDDQIFMPKVWDDVAFGPVNIGLSNQSIIQRVKNALVQTGLTGFENRITDKLSYGEKKLVAIAGIIAMEPSILLFDEPSTNLDYEGRTRVLKIIKSLKKTVIVATHDVNMAVYIGGKIAILDKEVIAYGPMSEILIDNTLLKKARIELPEITKFFAELKKNGYDCKKLPLTVDDALQYISDVFSNR